MIDQILIQRGKRYGDFEDNADLSQALKDTMRTAEYWELKPPFIREALDNIQAKIARMLNGDHLWIDSVTDIIGYATLMKECIDILNGETNEKEERISEQMGK